ncbi:hypothetical protein F2Q68_00001825 [Brassica cretica]|uniref:Uncharacterized protein n=1 Tax=Brassica cretica TaxID=69181 RepID=A0A8S9JAA0_BRACR|nr:hypothetical protein F2Q68_00001825 [Brassica cretica]
MNMSTSCSSPSSPRLFATKPQLYKAPLSSFSTPKRRRSPARRNRNSSDSTYRDGNLLTISTSSYYEEQSLSLTLDVHRISSLATSRFKLFLDSGKDAVSDLQTLVSLDDNKRVVVTCRKSTVQFVGGVVLLGLVFGFAIKLRRVCRIAGVQVSIEPTNTRDSFYRTSVDFVLNACSRAPWESSSVEICSEDAREFIAGLAENIGLAKIDAARMVSAAVAARTRSWFLQAWALEIQGKHSESVAELSKICLIHRIFPPEEYSAEMEMVARGLEKLMKLEERQSLMRTFVGMCCSEESQRSAAEALGLIPS